MRTLDWCFCLMCDLQSHHRPRVGPFELNDVFAIINAVPAIALLSYGFFNKGLVPGLCFGAVSACFLSFSFVCLFVCLYVTVAFFLLFTAESRFDLFRLLRRNMRYELSLKERKKV